MAIKNIPNMLTIFRIFLIPILVLSFFIDDKTMPYIAASIFVFASITDYFDGMLARRLKAHSNFGRMLDPIADKLLVAATLMMLVYLHKAPILPTIAILMREILVSGLREHLAEMKVNVPVSKLGKIKTALQMVAIIILTLGEEATGIAGINMVGDITIWLAAILTIISGYQYCREGFKHF